MDHNWVADEQKRLPGSVADFLDRKTFMSIAFSRSTRNSARFAKDYGAALYAAQAWTSEPEVSNQSHCIVTEIEMIVEEILANQSIHS